MRTFSRAFALLSLSALALCAHAQMTALDSSVAVPGRATVHAPLPTSGWNIPYGTTVTITADFVQSSPIDPRAFQQAYFGLQSRLYVPGGFQSDKRLMSMYAWNIFRDTADEGASEDYSLDLSQPMARGPMFKPLTWSIVRIAPDGSSVSVPFTYSYYSDPDNFQNKSFYWDLSGPMLPGYTYRITVAGRLSST